MSEKNGGAAFPVYPRIQGANSIEVQDATGMSLRDYFAAAVLPALVAQLPSLSVELGRFSMTTLAYEYADSMLQQRLVGAGRAREVKP